MRTIIAGSRNGTTMHHLAEAVTSCGWRPTVVLSGTARGADQLGEAWASRNSIPVERYPANWTLHGKSAGYKRNEEMAEKAEALIALWDGDSRGTKHMIDIARRKGLHVYVHMTTSNVSYAAGDTENEMLTLTGKEIKDLAEAVGLVIAPHDYADELETEMTIIDCPVGGVSDDDGKPTHYAHVAYLSEYPEEGTFPLGDEVTYNVS